MVKDMAKHMASERHYPPAYHRYRKEHPVISVVLTKEFKQLLDRQRKKEKQSYADLIKQFIEKGCDALKARQEAYAEVDKKLVEANKKVAEANKKSLAAYQEGYKKGRTFNLGLCSKCRRPLSWNLDNAKDMELLEKNINEAGYIHSSCQS